MKSDKPVCYAFIDAANLFYGGEKSLGWAIDYEKLLAYLKEKYLATRVFYYAGVEIGDFPYAVLDFKPIGLDQLLKFHNKKLSKDLSEAEILIIQKSIQRIKFYRKLEEFGYTLRLKPTKIFWNEGKPIKKANCDVDMTFELMRYMEQYSEAVVLSGDGDFAVVIKYLMSKKRKIHILARAERTAKEIRQLAGKKFSDFSYLREKLKYEKAK
ncbi:MAG: NYN domain-containing protein [Patescibacteria group bacterium]|nr:NYN domain-containing protein [Patescibacteria group bacterium]